MGERRRRHWRLQRAGRGKPQIEVLAKVFGGGGGLVVAGADGAALVPDMPAVKHRAVDEVQKSRCGRQRWVSARAAAWGDTPPAFRLTIFSIIIVDDIKYP